MLEPGKSAAHALGITRSWAKMEEFAVPPDDRISPTISPTAIADVALGIIGDAAASYGDVAIDPKRMAFVSQYFDSLIHGGDNRPYVDYARLLAAASYYLADYPGNAGVLTRRPFAAQIDALGLGEFLRRFLDDPFSTERMRWPAGSAFDAELRDFRKAVQAFLKTGASVEAVIGTLDTLRVSIYEKGSARELLLGDLTRACLIRHVRGFSPWVTLPLYSGLPLENWRDFITVKRPFRELWPSQVAIGESGIFQGRSGAIQIPTSGGKTKAVSLAIRCAFMSGRAKLALVVAPFNALCREIAADLQADFRGERDVKVGVVPDVRNSDSGVLRANGAKAIGVLTPEKLDYLLRVNPELSPEIGLIVYDEGHLLDDGTRGPMYELLLSSLKARLSSEAQVVFISAVVPNIAEIGRWLIGEDCGVVSGGRLTPTRRSIALVNWKGRRAQLQFISPENPARDEFFVPRMVDEYALELRGAERNERKFPATRISGAGRRRQTFRDPGQIGVLLASRLVQSGGVALFCGRKDSAVKVARDTVEAFSRGLPVAPPSVACDRRELERLSHYFSDLLGADSPATGACKLGILMHHGSMPLGARLCVEYAIQQQHAKVVLCTSTLAQGVNLPIRYLLIGGTSQGEDQIKVRDFHNLIGRAGRAGKFTEGVIIFIDPRIHDARAQKAWAWKNVEELLNPERAGSCASSLLDSISDRPQDPAEREGWQAHHDSCRRMIESFLLLTLDEVDDADAASEAAKGIAAQTLAYQQATTAQKGRLVALFDEIARAIVADEPDTGRRRIFSKTGVGLAQSKALADLVAGKADDEPPDTLAEALTLWWPALHPLLPKLMRAIPAGRALDTAQLWVSGAALPEITESLAGLTHGRRSFSGEDCVTICENELGFQGSLLIGSIAELLGDRHAMTSRLRTLQRALKAGLSLPSEMFIFEHIFPDRSLAQKVSHLIGHPDAARIPAEIFAHREEIEELLSERFPSYFGRRLEELVAVFM